MSNEHHQKAHDAVLCVKVEWGQNFKKVTRKDRLFLRVKNHIIVGDQDSRNVIFSSAGGSIPGMRCRIKLGAFRNFYVQKWKAELATRLSDESRL